MSSAAESYERYLVPSLFSPWASVLLDVARPQQGERLLDVACGTGVVARAAASMVSRQGTVSGLDLDESNVAVARLVAEQEQLTISWHTGRAEELPFPEAGFDLVVCQFGLMFFSDPSAALREMHRVLKPRGRLVLSTWQRLDRHPFHQAVHEATLARLGMSTVASVFSLGDPDQLRALVQDAGFHHVRLLQRSVTSHFPNGHEFVEFELGIDRARAPALQQLDRIDQRHIMDEVRAELAARLNRFVHDGVLVLPMHAHLVTAAP
jgi:ubiquinone/menaquinone biosynthesis C-methylase UbiE